jgi:hypothetical protein
MCDVHLCTIRPTGRAVSLRLEISMQNFSRALWVGFLAIGITIGTATL